MADDVPKQPWLPKRGDITDFTLLTVGWVMCAVLLSVMFGTNDVWWAVFGIGVVVGVLGVSSILNIRAYLRAWRRLESMTTSTILEFRKTFPLHHREITAKLLALPSPPERLALSKICTGEHEVWIVWAFLDEQHIVGLCPGHVICVEKAPGDGYLIAIDGELRQTGLPHIPAAIALTGHFIIRMEHPGEPGEVA